MDRTCHDCGAEPGALHELGCDTEQCYACGGQMLQCLRAAPCPHCPEQHHSLTCCDELLQEEERLPWTGEWPGVAECREYGLIITDLPGAIGREVEDTTALALMSTWDRRTGRIVADPVRLERWLAHNAKLPYHARYDQRNR